MGNVAGRKIVSLFDILYDTEKYQDTVKDKKREVSESFDSYFVKAEKKCIGNIQDKRKVLLEYKSYGEYLFNNGLSRTQAVLKYLDSIGEAEKELNSFSEDSKLNHSAKFMTDIDRKVSILCREITINDNNNRRRPVNVITNTPRITKFSMYRNAFYGMENIKYIDDNGRVHKDLFKVLENENIIPQNKPVCFPWVYAYYKGVDFNTFISLAREYTEDYNRLYGVDMETYLLYRIDGHSPEEIDAYKSKIISQNNGYFLFEGKWYRSILECIEVLDLDKKDIATVKKSYHLTTAQAVYYLADKEKQNYLLFKLSSNTDLTVKERQYYLDILGIPEGVYIKFRDTVFNGPEVNLMGFLIKNMYIITFNDIIYRNIQEIFDDYGYVDIFSVLENVLKGFSVENAIGLSI